MVDRLEYIQTRREQAYVKHYVLKNYLQQLALKIGNFKNGTTINYIDGFSGPWQQATEDLRDTSPHIALTELRLAKQVLAEQTSPRSLNIRAMFVENDTDAFELLQQIPAQFSEIECETYPGQFEGRIEEARRFATKGPTPFAFIFIDPTGWTGYGLQAISPLLQVRPSEVLINFMTKDITRFVDDTDSTALRSFIDLFGDPNYREAWRGLEGIEREDAIVTAYCDRIRRAGGFRHCVATIILNAKRDRTHYHLVYATRSIQGLITFRDTERKAVPEQRDIRADAKQRDRVARGQQEMFSAPVMETSYMAELQARYQQRARDEIIAILQPEVEVDYDLIVASALQHPMTSVSDLRCWIKAWLEEKSIEVIGLQGGERALAVSRRHRLRKRPGRTLR